MAQQNETAAPGEEGLSAGTPTPSTGPTVRRESVRPSTPGAHEALPEPPGEARQDPHPPEMLPFPLPSPRGLRLVPVQRSSRAQPAQAVTRPQKQQRDGDGGSAAPSSPQAAALHPTPTPPGLQPDTLRPTHRQHHWCALMGLRLTCQGGWPVGPCTPGPWARIWTRLHRGQAALPESSQPTEGPGRTAIRPASLRMEGGHQHPVGEPRRVGCPWGCCRDLKNIHSDESLAYLGHFLLFKYAKIHSTWCTVL